MNPRSTDCEVDALTTTPSGDGQAVVKGLKLGWQKQMGSAGPGMCGEKDDNSVVIVAPILKCQESKNDQRRPGKSKRRKQRRLI